MAAPAFINELTSAGSLSAGAALVVFQGGDTFRTTPQAIITEAESFAHLGTGAVSRDVQSHLRELVVNARGFGSKFATTPAADINLAITAVSDAGGGTVLVPAGDWTAETTIVMKSGVALRGVGIAATKITLASGVNKDLIRNPNNSFGVNGPDTYIQISDMELDGNKSQNATPGHSPDAYNACIRLKNVEKCLVERVYAHDALGYGVELKAAVDCVVSHCYATACGDDGFSVSDFGLGEVSYSKRNSFVSCFAWSNQPDHGQTSGSGFEVDDGPQDTSFVNCHSWDNEMGLYVHEHADALAPVGIQVIGGRFYSNDTDGIHVGSQGDAGLFSDNVIINGAVCEDNGNGGVLISKASRVQVFGCRTEGNDRGISVADCNVFLVADNMVRGNATRQIYVVGNVGFTTTKGMIRGNVVRADSATPNHGIRIDDVRCEDIVVDDNDVRDSTSSAATYVSDAGTRTILGDNIGVHLRTLNLSASVNDWNGDTSGAKLFRVTSSGSTPWTITGIANGTRYLGRSLTIVNADGVDTLVLAHQNAGSADANKIISSTGSDVTLSPGDYAELIYDDTTARWRMLGTNGA